MIVDGEEAGEWVVGLLREGIWFPKEEEEGESFPVLDEFRKPCSPPPLRFAGIYDGRNDC